MAVVEPMENPQPPVGQVLTRQDHAVNAEPKAGREPETAPPARRQWTAPAAATTKGAAVCFVKNPSTSSSAPSTIRLEGRPGQQQ